MKKRTVALLVAGTIGAGIGAWAIKPLAVVWGIWRCGRGLPETVDRRQRARLPTLIAFARRHSTYYGRLYRELPAGLVDLRALPVVTKSDLMAHFDEWVTDQHVTRAGVEAFVADPARIGRRYFGRYAIWTTSGTTGTPGIFVHDRQAVSVYAALVPLRGYRWLTLALLRRVLSSGRVAVLVATGAHFAIADWFEHVRRKLALLPAVRRRIQVFSVLAPLDDLVRTLNAFQPSLLLGYPSVIGLLATEQQAGRLRIRPEYVGAGGEWLDPVTRAKITDAFGCILRDNYGASEFPYVAFECAHGGLHVNADWVIMEPVDARYRPVPPGQPSHTVLLTNLANRVQPLIRYDLGDSITLRSDPCPCGSPLPAIQVQGRTGDILHLPTRAGTSVVVLPLAIGTVVEEIPGIQRVQVIQTTPDTLALRLEVAPEAERELVWHELARRLRAYLTTQGAPDITLTLAPEPPQQEPVGGKFRQVRSEVRAAGGTGTSR